MYLDINHVTFQYIDGFGYYHFCLNRLGLELFSFDSDIQSKFETAHSVAYQPKYLVMSILPYEANVVVILPFVRHDWLKWSHDKYDTHKKTRIRV